MLLILMVLWIGLQCATVVFPNHTCTHLFFLVLEVYDSSNFIGSDRKKKIVKL